MRRLPILSFVAALAVLTTADSASAQMFDTTGQPFVGTGTAKLRRGPEFMRVILPLSAQGQNVREAARALTEKADSVSQQLVVIGAAQESVSVAALRIDESTSDTHRQMLSQMRSMMGSGFGGAFGGADDADEPPEVSELVSVRTALTADFGLDESDAIELLARTYELQQTIREAKLNGDVGEELSPEEQEMLEEAAMYGGSGEENPNEPVFLYVGTISGEERSALMKEAFAKASAAAAELAAAAGVRLGELGSVREGAGAETDWDGYASMGGYGYSSARYQAVERAKAQLAQTEQMTSVGTSPTELTFSVSVTAGFAIGK